MTNREEETVFLVDFAGMRNIRVPLRQKDVDDLDRLGGGYLERVRERVYDAIRLELAQHHDLFYPADYRSRFWEDYNIGVKYPVGPRPS